jgi:hypothetical protein
VELFSPALGAQGLVFRYYGAKELARVLKPGASTT